MYGTVMYGYKEHKFFAKMNKYKDNLLTHVLFNLNMSRQKMGCAAKTCG